MPPDLEVIPLTVHTGAEIRGVDLSAPLQDDEVRSIRQALLQWKVIFFRGQHLDHSQHIAFARRFGEPTPGHVVFGNESNLPEIYPVTKHRTAFAARPDAVRHWTDWHTDITAAVNPPFASILRAVVVPLYGRDTQWTNMEVAYRALSPAMQEFLSGLRAVHRFKRADGGDQAADYNAKVTAADLLSEHPLVHSHPETGNPSLYTNQEFVREIVGLSPRESEAILEFLWEHCIRAEFAVRFKWEEGSIAFWDNRSTQHLAIRDVYQTDFPREFYRVTLNGAPLTGMDGQPSRALSGQAIRAV